MSRVDFYADLLRPVLEGTTPFWTSTEVRRLSDGVASVMPTPSLPSANETAAVALRRPKTAALAFDKVWAGVFSDVPDRLAFFGDTDVEHQLTALWFLRRYALAKSERYAYLFTPEHRERLLDTFLQLLRRTAPQDIAEYVATTGDAEPMSRVFADAIAVRHQISIVPIYSADASRAREYSAGSRAAVFMVLSGIDMVDEQSLEWRQVLEFRRDNASRLKYRRFLHWLDAELVGKPISFVQDEINIRLADYQNAIRKHGLRTIVGTCSAILDPRTLVPAAGVYGTFAAFAHDLVGALAAGSLVLARGAVHVANALLDLDDTRSTRPEVAFVYELMRGK